MAERLCVTVEEFRLAIPKSTSIWTHLALGLADTAGYDMNRITTTD